MTWLVDKQAGLLPMEEMDSIGQGKSRGTSQGKQGHPGEAVTCVFLNIFHWGSEAFNSESLIIFQSTNIVFLLSICKCCISLNE